MAVDGRGLDAPDDHPPRAHARMASGPPGRVRPERGAADPRSALDRRHPHQPKQLPELRERRRLSRVPALEGPLRDDCAAWERRPEAVWACARNQVKDTEE